jgi:hypothetical protein
MSDEQQRLDRIIEMIKQVPEGKMLADSKFIVKFMKEQSNLRGKYEPETKIIYLNPELKDDELLTTLAWGLRHHWQEGAMPLASSPVKRSPPHGPR